MTTAAVRREAATPPGSSPQESFFVVIFAVSGIRKIVEFPVFVAFIASKGLPFPEACAVLAAILEIGGTVLLVVGWKTRQTALVLAFYTVFLAFVFHDFWNMQSANLQGAQASNQMNHFLKNISIAGGLLLLAALGPRIVECRHALEEGGGPACESAAEPDRGRAHARARMPALAVRLTQLC